MRPRLLAKECEAAAALVFVLAEEKEQNKVPKKRKEIASYLTEQNHFFGTTIPMGLQVPAEAREEQHFSPVMQCRKCSGISGLLTLDLL